MSKIVEPSNFEQIMKDLQKRISSRLNSAADKIVQEEVRKILGRVKIFRRADLRDMNYDWFINAEEKE